MREAGTGGGREEERGSVLSLSGQLSERERGDLEVKWLGQ